MLSRLAFVVACGVTACAPSEPAPERLVFEPFSPPQLTSHDLFVGGRGDIVVMANRISRDGGLTWKALDPRIAPLSRVGITGSVVTLYAAAVGLARWDLATDQITPVAGAPSFATNRTWRIDPANGRVFVFDSVANLIASAGTGSWTTGTLPRPSTTEVSPYIKDLESNGTTVLTVSAWGIHRSLDGAATWQLVTPSIPGAGRDLLVLADGRFLLIGGVTSYAFDATGRPAGSLPGITAELGDASACEDGSIVVHDKLSRDLGKTWEPLLDTGELAMSIEQIGCASTRYWMLARSDTWGYRLAQFGPGTPPVAAGNWESTTPAWSAGGPPITRSPDGTFLVAGLAWRDGDEGWRVRELPAHAWAAGDLVFGVSRRRFYASHDQGATWTARAAVGLELDPIDAFARGGDGSLVLSAFTGARADQRDTWHSVVSRSGDDGASWTVVYDASVTRGPGAHREGEAHQLVGLAGDGAWIATDAISRDQGATWQATAVKLAHGIAFVAPQDRLITADTLWHVYDRGGEGDLLATFQLEVDGANVAGSAVSSVAFDDLGFAYIAGGSPYVQVWRSQRPVE